MKLFRNNRGLNVLAILLASTIVAVAFVYFIQSNRSLKKKGKILYEEALAQSYATELLEFLRSHTDERLDEFLERNIGPSGQDFTVAPCLGASPPAAQCDAYPICSHINILDRATGNVYNPTNVAALAVDNPLHRPKRTTDPAGVSYQANRWFQVQIVNLANVITQGTGSCPGGAKDCGQLVVRRDLCDDTTRDHRFGATGNGTAIANPDDHKFLITVGVSWIPRNIENPDITQDVKRVVMSTIIPADHS